jgi:hypothetical protein
VVSLPREPKELAVADKSPRNSSAKKPGKSIKEKRADKKASAASKSTAMPSSTPPRGSGK